MWKLPPTPTQNKQYDTACLLPFPTRHCKKRAPADAVTGSLPDHALMGWTLPLSEKTLFHQLQNAVPATYTPTLHERGLKCSRLSLKRKVVTSVEATQKHYASFTQEENSYIGISKLFVIFFMLMT